MSQHLPPMQLFQQVPVVPVSAVKRSIGQGGPIWPDYDHQITPRHCRAGLPVDRRPAAPRRARPLRQPAVWGGFLINQFGHLVAEQLPRLPQSLRDRPDDLYLFTVHPGQDAETLPDYIWQALDWFGLRRNQVRLISEPVVADELRVAAQGEMLGRCDISPAYLDMVDALAARNALRPERAEVVFVTRAGLPAKGKAGHLGESYLAGLLARLGVRVLDPAKAPLRDQLAAYAGAAVLVFSEGSALHGRGLLGRIDQQIHVLRRRATHFTARNQTTPRCRALCYHTTVAGALTATMPGGRERPDLALAFYDLPALFACFAQLGIDLAAHWDAAAYRAAQEAEAALWLETCPLSDDCRAQNRATLVALGFHLPAATPRPTPASPLAHGGPAARLN